MDPHSATVTLCVAAAAGTLLVALADRLRTPSIALLLLGGIALGPEWLGVIDPRVLGRGIETVVGLSVAIILFEGGLTLDLVGLRRKPAVIARMLTIGVTVTWAAAAAAVYFVLDLPLPLAVLLGSMTIVTGPTVISPLLRRTGIKPRLHHILYWEGVIVDAVGVFAAVMCFEWIASTGDEALLAPLGRFISRFAIGVGIGAAIGLVVAEALRRKWVGAAHANIVCVGAALLAYGGSNSILHESGILAVIIAGLVINVRGAPDLRRVKRFELELTELGIGLLFILLAAKLELSAFVNGGAPLAAVIAVLVLVVRPLSIAASTFRQGLSWRERAFLAWVAPRGIVAASMASLFTLRLTATGHPRAAVLEIIVFALIGVTVLLQGLSTPLLARLLGLMKAKQSPLVLAGQKEIVMELHHRLREAGVPSLALAPGRAKSESGEHPLTTAEGTGAAKETGDTSEAQPIDLADVEEVLAIVDGTPRLQESLMLFRTSLGEATLRVWGDDEKNKHTIFDNVPSPAVVAEGLRARRLSIDLVETGDEEMRHRFCESLLPLVAITSRGAEVVTGDIPAEATRVVVLRQRIAGLYGLIQDGVILDRADLSFADVIRELLALAALSVPTLKIDECATELLEREASISTAIGNGVAVPHLYVEGIAKSAVFVALAAKATGIDGPDGEPVRLVFLLISPSGEPTQHLKGLAAVAGLASDHRMISVISHQVTKARLLSLLRERE